MFIQRLDLQRCSNTGHHILPRGVEQVFAKEEMLPGRRVASKGDAGAGVVAKVTKHHGLYTHRRTKGIWNIVHLAIDIGARGVPGEEDGLYRQFELHKWVLGEIRKRLINGNNRLPVLGIHVYVQDLAVSRFVFFDLVLE